MTAACIKLFNLDNLTVNSKFCDQHLLYLSHPQNCEQEYSCTSFMEHKTASKINKRSSRGAWVFRRIEWNRKPRDLDEECGDNLTKGIEQTPTYKGHIHNEYVHGLLYGSNTMQYHTP